MPDFPLTEDQQAIIANAGQSNISFTTEADKTEVSFIPDGTKAPPSPQLAQTRSTKAAYGTGQKQEDILTAISQGREDMIRDSAAKQADTDWARQKNNILQEYVKRSGGKAPPEHLDILSSMSKEEFQHDPATIFEKKFSQKYIRDQVVDSAVNAPEGMWGKAFKQNPVATAQNMRIFANQQAKAEYINTVTENLDDESKQSSWMGSTWNFIKSVTPGLSWYNQSRLLKEAPWSGLSLPGATRREQISYLLSLPLDQAKPLIDQSIATLKGINLNDAKEFAHALQGYSTSDEFLFSSTGILDLSLLPIGRAARGLTNLGKRALGRGAVDEAARIPTGRYPEFVGGSERSGTTRIDLNQLPPINEVVQDALRAERFEPVQLDLFRGDPRQGDLFPSLRAGEAQTPPSTQGLPPGRLRSTYKPIAEQEAESNARAMLPGRSLASGRFEAGQGAYVQGELPLTGGQGQRSFDFTTTAGKKAVEDGIDRMISFAGFSKGARALNESPAIAAAEAGKTAQAALYGAAERMNQWKDAPMHPADGLLSSHDPMNYFGNSKALSNQRALELTKNAENLDTRLEKVMDESLRIKRLDPSVEKEAFKTAENRLRDNNTHKFGDGILDVVHLPSTLFKSNVGQAVLRVGDPKTKLPFASRDAAELYAKDIYKLAPDEYKLYVKGSEYYIGVSANIAENTDRTFNAIVNLKNVVDTSIFTLLNKFKMTDSYLAPSENAQRKVAAHAQQTMKALVRETADVFVGLGPKAAKEVETVIGDFGNARKWFNSAAEFEDAFAKRFSKLATEKQINGAYVYKQLQDYDFMVRNMGVYRDMARQGAEQHSVLTKAGKSEYFNGIQKEGIPWGRGEDFTIATYKAGEDGAKVGWAHQAERAEGQLTKKEIDELVTKQGYRVIQIFEPSDRPLSKAIQGLDSHVNYLVTNASETKPLAWQQLKYEPGPHSIYPYEFYIKQPKIATGHLGKDYYYGDNTLWNFSTEAEANMWLERLNTARAMAVAKDPALDAYLAKNLPYNKAEFNTLRNQFDMDVPFAVTQRGKSVFDTQIELDKAHPGMINFHKSSHNPQNFMDRTFLQERDALLNNPVERNGVLKFEEAKQLDPYHALERGLSQSIRSMWLSDYKVSAVTNWIENYADVMRHDINTLRATPMFYLYNAEGAYKNVAKTEKAYTKLVAAEQERQAIINFIGQSSDIGNAREVLKNKLMDTIYNRGGGDTANYVADHYLNFIKDPLPYFRGLAAHSKIGLFNPIPMIQQGMVLGNVAAVIPEHAVKSTAAAFLMNGLNHTAEPAIINATAKKLTKFGFKEAEAKELIEAWRASGLEYVGSEASFRHDNFDARLFRSIYGVFFDKGFTFFNMGERFGRKAAFSASYAEWRAANPGIKLGEAEIAAIQQRADTITGHMTSASLSNMQKGIMSIPLQFTTYYNHMAQLMMGKELSVAEKARMFAVNSAMFGVPFGLGVGGLPGAVGGAASGYAKDGLSGAVIHGAAATMGMWPIYDDIMEEAKKRGIDMSPLYIQALMKGIPNVMAQIVLNKDPDINKVYAPGSNSMIRDILRKDKGFLEVMGGASGSVIKDILDSSEPLLGRLSDAIMGGNKEAFGPVQGSDFLKLFRNVGSLDLGAKVYAAAAYGKFITRHGIEVGPLDNMDAVLTAFRLTPVQVQDMYTTMGTLQDQKKHQEKIEKLALESLRRGTSYAAQGDWDKYYEHLKDTNRWIEIGDFSPSDRDRIFKRAVEESRGIDENIHRQFLKKSPQSLQIDRYQQHFNKGSNP